MKNPRCLASFATALIILCLGTTAHASYQRIYAAEAPMPLEVYRLDNGLTVYLSPNDQAPRFYAEIAVRAGSKNDPAETTGLAHYLEHLLFKGSQKLGTTDYAAEEAHLDQIRDLYEAHFLEEDPQKRAEIYEEINRQTQASAQYAIPNELDKIYKSFGASGLNAHTSVEETVYKVSLPKNRFAQWAALESDRFAHPVFRLFITELETVYEEKNRSLDNRELLLHEAVMEALFKNHPYGQQTTLGESEHLKRPSILNIETFYRKNYVPSNMAVFVSGDLDMRQAIETIDEYFSAWEAQAPPQPQSWDEEPLADAERVTVPYPGEEKVLLAFRTAPQGHPDEEALKILDMILDNSVAGLINLNLNQAQKVREAGSFPMLMNDYGAQFLWGIPKSGQTLDEVEQLLLDQLALIQAGEFDEWIIAAIVNDFEKTQKLGMEENAGRVGLMRDAFIAGEEWPEFIGELERMRQVTKDDIVRVANKYFSRGHIAGRRVDEPREVPFIEKPVLDPVEIDPSRQSPFAAGILAMEAPQIQPEFIDPQNDYTATDTEAGVRFYYTHNPINDLFSLSIRVEKGSRHDRRLPVAVLLLEKAGTQSLSPSQLQKEWYRLGTTFEAAVGENETVFSISGLDRNFAASLALLDEFLRAPQSDQATLDQLVEIVLAQREDAKRDHNTILSALTLFNRYGVQSRYLQLLPSEEMKALRADELLEAMTDLLTLKHKVLYAGSRPEAEVLAMVEQQTAAEQTLADPPPYVNLEPRQVEATEVYFFDKELAQSLIRLEFPDGKFEAGTIPAVELFNDYFDGGMGGVVWQELREARALAYIVGAQYQIPERKAGSNIMVGVVHTQPDKAREAVEAFANLMDDIPASPERFAETLNSVENQYRTAHIGFRSLLGAVLDWERLEMQVDPRRQWFEAIQNMSLDDLLAFQQTHIQGRPKLISIVGDSARMDLEGIESAGAIKTLTVDDLFVE